MKKYLFAFSFIISNIGNACLILFMSNGDEVLVANHEDWFAKNAAVRYIPSNNVRYASIVFTFEDEGWAQGGMNEHGLFFDGALTPNPTLQQDVNKEPYQGYIWQAVLDNCKTVQEALHFIRIFKLTDLESAHIMIADAGGNAALIGIEQGKVVVEKRTDQLLQTNFNKWHPELSEEPSCERFNTAAQVIYNKEVTKGLMLDVLRTTHQDSLTIYSNIYDLKRKQVTVYSQRQFDKPINLSFDQFGDQDCVVPLIQLVDGEQAHCGQKFFSLSGVVTDDQGEVIPFANIGIRETYVGTISDPDGSYVLDLPLDRLDAEVTFSSIGYADKVIKAAKLMHTSKVEMTEDATLLEEVVVERKKSYRKVRIGHMGGKDGVIPFDSISGGGAVTMLMEAPVTGFYVDKLQFRLLFNSKDTSRFRLHFYEVDTVCQCPGDELLSEEIILKGEKRFGWERFDLADQEIYIRDKQVFVGFEWVEDRAAREQMLAGLKDWETWKRVQHAKGDEKVEKVRSRHPNGREWVYYKYHGNMMNWPGWESLPPFTGLMVETGKREGTKRFKTFERKTSFSPWEEKNVTLNAVIQISY